MGDRLPDMHKALGAPGSGEEEHGGIGMEEGQQMVLKKTGLLDRWAPELDHSNPCKGEGWEESPQSCPPTSTCTLGDCLTYRVTEGLLF